MHGKKPARFYPGLEGCFAFPKQNGKIPVAFCFSKASVKCGKELFCENKKEKGKNLSF
jgi:hypothetical protein